MSDGIHGDLKERKVVESQVKRLVMQANDMHDSEEVVYSGELFLLRRVFEFASYFERSKNYPDFGERHPPKESEKCLFEEVHAFKLYLSEFE